VPGEPLLSTHVKFNEEASRDGGRAALRAEMQDGEHERSSRRARHGHRHDAGHLSRLFQAFTQRDASTRRGSADRVGLAIKQASGGSDWAAGSGRERAEARVDVHFTFRAPLAPCAQTPSDRDRPGYAAACGCSWWTTTATNRKICERSRVLGHGGLDSVVSGDGARNLRQEPPFQLALLDYTAGRMDGPKRLAREIRRSRRRWPPTSP